MLALALRDTTKIYADGTVALAGVDLTVEPGEFLVIVGPAGSGKSTLLRIVSGEDTASGGTVARDGEIAVIDGPLSNVDASVTFADRGRVTTLYATDDPIEATMLADRIAVLDAGRLRQVGTPKELYDAPADTFVAGFLGAPAMNLAAGRVFGLTDDVVVGLRPGALSLDGEGAHRFEVTAITVESLDGDRYVLFQPSPESSLWSAPLRPGASVRPGQTITVTADVTRACLFDAVTGTALQRQGANA